MGLLAPIARLFSRPPTVHQQLAEQRARVELAEAKIHGRRLERQAKLLESIGGFAEYDWVSAYSDLLSRFRNEPTAFQPSTLYDRRYGRDYPMFQTEQELA